LVYFKKLQLVTHYNYFIDDPQVLSGVPFTSHLKNSVEKYATLLVTEIILYKNGVGLLLDAFFKFF